MDSNKKYEETLSQIGEKEILNRLKEFVDIGQINDDTALIKANKKDLLINTDLLVEDVHFKKETSFPKAIGWKAVAVNLSDLAASGVEDIIGITVGLVTPSSTDWKWIEGVYQGIEDALKTFGGKILGGDCSQGPTKLLSITAIGTKGPIDLHRSNALAGDALVSSGPHGLSRLGLGLLMSEPFTKSIRLKESLKKKAIEAHQKPYPRIDALKTLIKSKPISLPCKAAAIDSSDGLLQAIQSLCESSNCSAILERENLPFNQEWPKGKQWKEWCLNGGEDYELIVSLNPVWAEAWINNFPSSKIIGRMKTGSPKIIWSDGKEIKISTKNSYRHF